MRPTKPTVPALTTASAVSEAQATNSTVRHASSASPTVRARSSPAASTFSGRATTTANATARSAAPALSHGFTAHSRSPASQNTMPRTRDESASASNTLTSAPHALASTTPVSSSLGVPPPRASRYTAPTAASAPATAADCTTSAAAPAIIANNAPTAAPPETPSTYGSASGLRNSACSNTPESAKRLPTPKPASTRGNLTAISTVRVASSPPPPSAASALGTLMPELPMSNAATNTATASNSSSASLRSGTSGTNLDSGTDAEPAPGADTVVSVTEFVGKRHPSRLLHSVPPCVSRRRRLWQTVSRQ